MQINSINYYERIQRTNTVSMSGRVPDKSVVIDRVWKFLNENTLEFNGSFNVGISGMTKFRDVILGNRIGHLKNLWYVKMEKGLEEIVIKEASSTDDLAYKFAKKVSGKTIHNPAEAANQAGISLMSGKEAKGYVHTLKVPDFFAVPKTYVKMD